MNIVNVTTWRELLEYISEFYYGMNLKKIAKDKLRIGEKSYYDICNGLIPGKNLSRKIRGFVRDNFHAKIIIINGVTIKVKMI